MKTIALLICVCFTHFASAQGTLAFRADLGSGSAHFTLSAEGHLSGTANFSKLYGLSGVFIADSQKNLLWAATSFGHDPNVPPDHSSPFDFIVASWEPRALSQGEISRLTAQDFYIFVPSADQPPVRPPDQGDLFGQIVLVPEPRASIVFFTGVLLLSILIRKRKRSHASKLLATKP